MHTLDRRHFLTSSLGGLAALSLGPSLLAQEPGRPIILAGSGFAPDSLFLTWQRDPTTTMTVQWIGPESSADTSIHYAPLGMELWQSAKTSTKPYPDTDLKVHRCELTSLTPGAGDA